MNREITTNSTIRRRKRRVSVRNKTLISTAGVFILIQLAAILSLSVLNTAKAQNPNNVDYTCDARLDYGPSNECPGIQNGKCENPNHGGAGSIDECINQDCIDCNFHCKYIMH